LLWLQEPRGVDDLQEVVLHGEGQSGSGPYWLDLVHPPRATPQFCTVFYSYDAISDSTHYIGLDSAHPKIHAHLASQKATFFSMALVKTLEMISFKAGHDGAHHNPNYSEDGSRRILSLKPTQAKLARSYLKSKIKGLGHGSSGRRLA
jgi:hypothetical protein